MTSLEPKRRRNRFSEAFHYLSKIYPTRRSSNKSLISSCKGKKSHCYSSGSDGDGDGDRGECKAPRTICSDHSQTTAVCSQDESLGQEQGQGLGGDKEDNGGNVRRKVILPPWTAPESVLLSETNMSKTDENERGSVTKKEAAGGGGDGADLFTRPYAGDDGPNDSPRECVTVSVETREGRVFDDIAEGIPTSSEELSQAYRELVDVLATDMDPFTAPLSQTKLVHKPPCLQQPDRSVEQLTARRTSDVSLLSEKSSSTVQRYPSRHASPPVLTNINSILHNLDFGHSGDDRQPAEETGSEEKREEGEEEEDVPVLLSLTPQSAEKHPSRGDSHLHHHAHASSSSNGRSFLKSKSGSSKSWGYFSRSRKSDRSSASLSQRILSTSGSERRNLLRLKSLASLKASARAFGLAIPGVNEVTPGIPVTKESTAKSSSGEALDTTALTSGGQTFRGRLRSVRSSLHVKRNPKMKRTLRRIKTMASLSVQFPPHSLQGKSLEELTRLGGHGSFKMPSHYAPAPLKLPACIAASCVFLTKFGLRAPGLFQDTGDDTIVAELYSHFATQILQPSADGKDDMIIATRKIELPLESMKQAQVRGEAFVHDVCTVFRCFLYAVRGGIFGSWPLYEVLRNINRHAFTANNVPKDPGRDEYVGDTPTPSAAKVRLVALSIVALADHLHLELICAVFGLLSMVVDECRMRQQLHAHFHGGPGKLCGQCEGLPNMRIISQVIGPLLIETPTSGEWAGHGHDDRFAAPEKNGDLVSEKVDVAAMLIGAWKDVCLQLQTWDIFGL